MAVPFFLAALDLNARLCVVIGSGEEALLRARTLVEHGARVRLVAPEPSVELAQWAIAQPAIELRKKNPDADDLAEAWLVIVADQNADWVARFGPLARDRKTLFCAIDQPTHNTFAHVGIARAGALQIGISTSGVVPGIAGALKRAFQKLLDDSNFENVVQRVTRLRETAPLDQRGRLVRNLASRIRVEGRLVLADEADSERG